MKRNSKTIGRFLTVAILSVAFGAAIAQSENSQATTWFNRGLSEKEPQKKIAAYTKALEFDPTLIEALYNLGLIYMQQNDYARAEEFLSRALNARPNQISSKLRTQTLYYIAMINKQLDNLQACENNLLEAKKGAQDKSLQTKIMSELGRLYFKQERYDEALQELKRGRDLDKSSSSFFSNLIQIIEKEMQMEKVYSEAERSLANGNLLQAHLLFQQLRSANPNFKDVQAKISMTDSLLKVRAEEDILGELYRQAARYADEGALQNAIATYAILLQQSPNFMDAQVQLAAVKRRFEEEGRARALQEEYGIGIDALAKGNWTRAIIAFEKVLEIDPLHPEGRNKLSQANRGLQDESTESIVRQFYNDAVSAMGRGDQASALAALEKVRHLNPQFKDAESLITKLESELKSEPVAADSTLASYYKSLHEDAVKALNNENWLQAVLRLEKLRVLKPDDQDVMKLLAHARANLQLAPSANAANARSKYSSRVYLAGACVALVMVPLLGFWFFSATSRARFQFLRGNYVRASQIYERLLSQHPEKVKLYIKLANIYLISGRDDDRAFRVFKTIVNLNLAPHIHPQINSVLAQRYLTNGTSNPDAIAVLENALKTEQSKENNL